VTEADVEVLGWTDIVRVSMDQGIAATYGQMLRTAWIYLSTGTFRRLFWLSKGPMIAAVYPVAMLLLQLVLAVAAGWIVGGVVGGATWSLVGWVVGVPLALVILRAFRRIDGRLYAHYLMHDYAFSAGTGARRRPLSPRGRRTSPPASPPHSSTTWTRCWWWAIPRARPSRWRCSPGWCARRSRATGSSPCFRF
jgi:hypothetical protein